MGLKHEERNVIQIQQGHPPLRFLSEGLSFTNNQSQRVNEASRKIRGIRGHSYYQTGKTKSLNYRNIRHSLAI